MFGTTHSHDFEHWHYISDITAECNTANKALDLWFFSPQLFGTVFIVSWHADVCTKCGSTLPACMPNDTS